MPDGEQRCAGKRGKVGGARDKEEQHCGCRGGPRGRPNRAGQSKQGSRRGGKPAPIWNEYLMRVPAWYITRGRAGPEGVQLCLAPGERSEPGVSCEPSWHRPRFRGRMARVGVSRVPGCYWTPPGPVTGRCFYPGVHVVHPRISMVRPLRGRVAYEGARWGCGVCRTSCEVRALCA